MLLYSLVASFFPLAICSEVQNENKIAFKEFKLFSTLVCLAMAQQ